MPRRPACLPRWVRCPHEAVCLSRGVSEGVRQPLRSCSARLAVLGSSGLRSCHHDSRGARVRGCGAAVRPWTRSSTCTKSQALCPMDAAEMLYEAQLHTQLPFTPSPPCLQSQILLAEVTLQGFSTVSHRAQMEKPDAVQSLPANGAAPPEMTGRRQRVCKCLYTGHMHPRRGRDCGADVLRFGQVLTCVLREAAPSRHIHLTRQYGRQRAFLPDRPYGTELTV